MSDSQGCVAQWLGLSPALLAHILANDDTHALVLVDDLLPCMGNKLLAHKMLPSDVVLESCTSMPTLVMNPSCGQLVLMEGNHRLHAFHMGGREWFPVRLMVVYGQPYGTRGSFHKLLPEDCYGFSAKEEPKQALREMFGMKVLF
jgi:hypothetical protein